MIYFEFLGFVGDSASRSSLGIFSMVSKITKNFSDPYRVWFACKNVCAESYVVGQISFVLYDAYILSYGWRDSMVAFFYGDGQSRISSG